MICVYLGKHKRSAVGGLEHLVERGCEVRAVVAPPPDERAAPEQRLDLAAERHGLPLTSDERDIELSGVDLVLSFLFWRLIRPPLLTAGRVGCLNFHPAPLPDLRGLGGYNVAILEGWREWGVSAHFVDERFDTGDLVRVERFPLDPETATALSLDVESQQRLLALFRWTIDTALAGEELPRSVQREGRYVGRAEFEALRRVRPEDPPELTQRRIRAFWYPPHRGATFEVGGQELTLVDDRLLDELARVQRNAGLFP